MKMIVQPDQQQPPPDVWPTGLLSTLILPLLSCDTDDGPMRFLISAAIVMNACSTLVAFFALVSKNGMLSWSAYSCAGKENMLTQDKKVSFTKWISQKELSCPTNKQTQQTNTSDCSTKPPLIVICQKKKKKKRRHILDCPPSKPISTPSTQRSVHTFLFFFWSQQFLQIGCYMWVHNC